MNALVVGSSGFLGRAVTARLRAAGSTVRGTFLRNPEPDALRFDFWRDDVAPLLEETGADTVVFTAAVETRAPTSDLTERTTSFFKTCADRRVVYLSSDALFDGLKGTYEESDPPSPTTRYGRNLAAVEEAVRRLCPDACVLRPSYLYGFSAGRLDDRLEGVRRQLLSGEAVRFADDLFKSPMEVTLAAEAVVTLARSGYLGTVHLSGARTSVYDFYWDALTALGVPTENLVADRLPADTPIPRDTSLHAALMTRLTGVPVLAVREALRPGSLL